MPRRPLPWRPPSRPGPTGHRGLAGPPGAAKSTLALALVGHARPRMGHTWGAYFPMDGHHLANAQLARLGLETARARGHRPTQALADRTSSIVPRTVRQAFTTCSR